MDALRVAAPLARLLLAWGEAGRQGELVIEQRACRAQLRVAHGRLLSLRGVEVRPLGDTLLALGALDLPSQRLLLEHTSTDQPVGARLVAAGATSSAAVQRALALQLAHGVDVLLRWPVTGVRVGAGASVEVESASGPAIDLSVAVWSSLLALAAQLSEAALSTLSGEQALVLTSVGQERTRLLVDAWRSGALEASCLRRALATHEEPQQPLALCEETLQRALRGDGSREVRMLRAILRVLGAARPEGHAPGEDPYALLLRKTRELARNASAHVLLDLPELAGAAHARKALRRLAFKLHPDRFQACDARLQAVSERVMGALSNAELALRSA